MIRGKARHQLFLPDELSKRLTAVAKTQKRVRSDLLVEMVDAWMNRRAVPQVDERIAAKLDRIARAVDAGNGATARRRWSDEDKARLVTDALEARATVRTVARRHGFCASLLNRWRRLFLTERLVPAAGFVLVRLALPGAGSEPIPALMASLLPGAIEVTTTAGHRLRVMPSVDRAALRLILDALPR